jgi:hypothetical protein
MSNSLLKFGQLCILLLLVSGKCAATSLFGVPLQAQELFADAVADASTSPHYVQYFFETEDGKSHATCTLGWNLNLAIRIEHGIPSNRGGIRAAAEIAFSSPDRKFRFKEPAARAALPITFSDEELDVARKNLAGFSDGDVREGFSLRPWGALHASLRTARERDAAACALIERGFAPGLADRINTLYINK